MPARAFLKSTRNCKYKEKLNFVEFRLVFFGKTGTIRQSLFWLCPQETQVREYLFKKEYLQPKIENTAGYKCWTILFVIMFCLLLFWKWVKGNDYSSVVSGIFITNFKFCLVSAAFPCNHPPIDRRIVTSHLNLRGLNWSEIKICKLRGKAAEKSRFFKWNEICPSLLILLLFLYTAMSILFKSYRLCVFCDLSQVIPVNLLLPLSVVAEILKQGKARLLV